MTKNILKTKTFLGAFFATAAGITSPAAADVPDAPPVVEWNEVSVLSDRSSIEEKLERLRTDTAYAAVLHSMAARDLERGIISRSVARQQDPAAYLYFLETFVNAAITPDILAAQASLDDYDPQNRTLDQNLQTVMDCRENTESPDNQSRYLRHQQLRGCALNALNTLSAGEDDIASVREYALAAPYSLSVKLGAYQSSEPRYQAYARAIQRQTADLIKHDYIGSMYKRDAIRFADAALDRSVTYDSFQRLPDNENQADREFFWRWPGAPVIDNNMQFLFECRDQLVPQNAPQDINVRYNLLNEVLVCSLDRMRAADAELTRSLNERAPQAEIDPAPLSQKLDEYSYTDEFYKSYQDGVRGVANTYSATGGSYYVNIIRLWDVMLDPDANWNALKNLKNPDDPGSLDFAWNTTSPQPDRNMRYMFECRAEHLPENLSETDMGARRDAFNAITGCWINKTNAQTQAISAEQDVQYQETIENLKNNGLIGGLGLFGLAGLGFGVRGYNHYRKNKAKQPRN